MQPEPQIEPEDDNKNNKLYHKQFLEDCWFEMEKSMDMREEKHQYYAALQDVSLLDDFCG